MILGVYAKTFGADCCQRTRAQQSSYIYCFLISFSVYCVRARKRVCVCVHILTVLEHASPRIWVFGKAKNFSFFSSVFITACQFLLRQRVFRMGVTMTSCFFAIRDGFQHTFQTLNTRHNR